MLHFFYIVILDNIVYIIEDNVSQSFENNKFINKKIKIRVDITEMICYYKAVEKYVTIS